MVTSDGSFKSFYFREDGPVLTHRLEARDIISFHPSIGMTELEHEKQTRGRSDCFARMASGQFFGKKGRICSEVSLVKRLYWRICSIAGRYRGGSFWGQYWGPLVCTHKQQMDSGQLRPTLANRQLG